MHKRWQFDLGLCLVFITIMVLLFGCTPKQPVVVLPPNYEQRIDKTTNSIVATMPSGKTIADTILELHCGEEKKCIVSDLSRIYHIQIGEQQLFIQEAPSKSNLAQLAKCGQEYVCAITKDTITILKKKK